MVEQNSIIFNMKWKETKFSYFYPSSLHLPRLSSGDNESTFPSVKNIWKLKKVFFIETIVSRPELHYKQCNYFRFMLDQ